MNRVHYKTDEHYDDFRGSGKFRYVSLIMRWEPTGNDRVDDSQYFYVEHSFRFDRDEDKTNNDADKIAKSLEIFNEQFNYTPVENDVMAWEHTYYLFQNGKFESITRDVMSQNHLEICKSLV